MERTNMDPKADTDPESTPTGLVEHPVDPGRWQPDRFAESIKQALEDGLDPDTTWTEDDLTEPPPAGINRRPDLLPLPKAEDTESEAWFHWNTPLHRALWIEDLSSAELLIEKGADMDIYNAIGLTALHEAVRRRRPGVVEFLIKNGADINKPTGETKIHWKGSYRQKRNCDVENEGGNPPLHFALSNGDSDTMRLLRTHGADLSPTSYLGRWSLLDLALLAQDTGAVALLSSLGVQFSTHPPELPRPTELDRGSATALLAVATSSKMVPPEDLRPAYCYVLSQTATPDKQKDFQDPETIDKLFHKFFDVLQLGAGLKGSISSNADTVDFCSRCSEFRTQVFKDRSVPQNFKFRLYDDREQLSKCASDSCLICALVVDALNVADSYKKGGQQCKLTDQDPGVYINLHNNPRAWFNASVSCQMFNLRMQLSLKRVDESAFPISQLRADDKVLGTGSPRAFQTAKYWLTECLGSPAHSTCQESRRPRHGWLPARLLHVGSDDFDPYLVSNLDPVAAPPYIALSYSWEQFDNALRTSLANLAQHTRSIGSLSSLPPTIRDAIITTRALGYSFLWITPLCQIRDASSDLSQVDLNEEARLAFIHADLTIATMVGSSPTDPLFHARPSFPRSSPYPIHVPIWTPKATRPAWDSTSYTGFEKKIYTHAIFHSSLHDFKTFEFKGTVHADGWRLQEQMLSTRVLYFGNGLLHWECLCKYTTEVDPDCYLIRNVGFHERVNELLGPKCAIRGVEPKFSTFRGVSGPYICGISADKAWQRLVQEMSRRKFARVEDRLPAIMGIAKFMMENGVLGGAGGHEFVGGVWKGERLLESLCWNLKTATDGKDMIRPSWTWVGLKGEIEFRNLRDSSFTPAVAVQSVDVKVDPATFKVSGSIRLSGRLYPIKRFTADPERVKVGYAWEHYSFNCQAEDAYVLDIISYPPVWCSVQPPGAGCTFGSGNLPGETVFLVLEPVRKHRDGDFGSVNFRRVGIGSYNPSTLVPRVTRKRSCVGLLANMCRGGSAPPGPELVHSPVYDGSMTIV
ncbi:hypothetical protein QBC44DRAFT_127700 [Cladorrhinum sp. PSN332]|nr:hypothetical protein QBC44DRAFT_127700 [Cladorrhinum sp. PSN332]